MIYFLFLVLTALLHFVQAMVVFSFSFPGSEKTVYRTSYIYRARTDIVPVREPHGVLAPDLIVACFFLLSSGFQLIQCFIFLSKNFEDSVLWRYIEYSVSASLMFLLMGLLIGIDELIALVLLFTIMFATNMLGLAAQAAATEELRWLLHVAAWITYALPFALMCSYIARTDELSGLSVRILLSVYFVGALFSLFGVVQLLHFALGLSERTVATCYDILSLLAKSTLGWIVVSLMTDHVI